MPKYSVNVKWGRDLFPNVELNTDEHPNVFKDCLFKLTGVRQERQKLTIKGTVIKDNWGNVPITNNMTILLMGSKDDVPVEPGIRTRFIEDMNEAELASVYNLPAGLSNLGNTCYMNATVQCLKTVPELRQALKNYSGSITEGTVSSHSVIAALRDLYATMDKGAVIPPVMLLQVLQMILPRFAEKNEKGSFVQQDANECWTEILRILQERLLSLQIEGFTTKFEHFVDQYFGGMFEVVYKCLESDDEPPSKTEETFLQLSCFISQDVKFMQNGLKSRLTEQITKHSDMLGRNALYSKTSKISRLPAYLTIQFVRFYYKEKEAINAKILKEIKFPMEFDAYDLCTSQLQTSLNPIRELIEKNEHSNNKNSKSAGKDDLLESSSNEINVSYSFDTDLGSNNSGHYVLHAILTHRGRSSSSGHYVAWIRQNKNSWAKCDDDIVSPVTEEDLLKLSGGGDWHCAYVLLYGPKTLQVPKNY